MSGDRRTDLHPTTAGPALSGGPWLSDDHPGRGARYEPGGKLGAGGMGEVRLARDTILDRDVALKTPRRAEDDGALLAEARVTARLEHPSILPIYDAGRLDDGAAYYATRVFTGRTLADALEQAATVPERLKLIRHLLAVAQAIAYAHEAGVLHRDLKPANVMIGSFGETVVSDWGLATRIEGAVSNGSGTPGFMAPEQAAGGPIDARADVYAVGAMLRLLALGALPGAAPRLEGAPPELIAIASTATAADPSARYPRMAALAADLEAWLDGRRVQAHVYSTAELARRLLTRWRAPLAVAMVGLALLITAVGAGWWRTATERDRARLAEVEATRARNLSQQHLAEALVTQARFAADDDRRTEAEVLAAQALQYGPSAEARGVLARFGGRPRPTAVARGAAPPCLLHSLSPDGMTMACQQAEEVLTLDLREGVRVVDRHAARAAGATVTDGQATIAYVPDGALAAWRAGSPEARLAIPPPTIFGFGRANGPNESAVVFTGRAGWVRVGEAADGALALSLHLGSSCATPADVSPLGDAVIVGCIGGEVLRVRPGQAPQLLHQLSPASPAALATLGDDQIAVGTTSGELVLLDASGALLHRDQLGRSAARRVVMNEHYVAMLLEEGTLSVVERAHGTVVLRVSAPETSLAWLSDGRTLRTVNDQLVDWQLPDLSHPHRTTFNEGISAMAVDPAGGWVAVGTGDGGLDVFRLHDGAPVHHREGSPKLVVKDFGVSADGARVAIALSGPAPQPMVRVADWSDLTPWYSLGMRRIGFMGEALVGVTYDTRIVRFEDDGAWRMTPLATADAWDADITPSTAVALTTGGELWQLRDPSAARLVTTVAGTRAVATLGEDIVTAGPDGVRRIRPDGQILGPWPLIGDPVEIVTAHHQRWIVVGTTGGVFQVLHADTGEAIAVLRGHTGRGNLARFTADDAWLVTGSWDRDVRVWYVADLEAPVEDVLAQVSWEMPLSEALRQGRR